MTDRIDRSSGYVLGVPQLADQLGSGARIQHLAAAFTAYRLQLHRRGPGPVAALVETAFALGTSLARAGHVAALTEVHAGRMTTR